MHITPYAFCICEKNVNSNALLLQKFLPCDINRGYITVRYIYPTETWYFLKNIHIYSTLINHDRQLRSILLCVYEKVQLLIITDLHSYQCRWSWFARRQLWYWDYSVYLQVCYITQWHFHPVLKKNVDDDLVSWIWTKL